MKRILLILVLSISAVCNAQTPQWVNTTEFGVNMSIQYIDVGSIKRVGDVATYNTRFQWDWKMMGGNANSHPVKNGYQKINCRLRLIGTNNSTDWFPIAATGPDAISYNYVCR